MRLSDLSKGSVRIRFGQDIPVAVLVERVFGRVAMGREFQRRQVCGSPLLADRGSGIVCASYRRTTFALTSLDVAS